MALSTNTYHRCPTCGSTVANNAALPAIPVEGQEVWTKDDEIALLREQLRITTDRYTEAVARQAPAVAREADAYIEHHKAGDNLVWTREKTGRRYTPLYAAPPAEQAPAVAQAGPKQAPGAATMADDAMPALARLIKLRDELDRYTALRMRSYNPRTPLSDDERAELARIEDRSANGSRARDERDSWAAARRALSAPAVAREHDCSERPYSRDRNGLAYCDECDRRIECLDLLPDEPEVAAAAPPAEQAPPSHAEMMAAIERGEPFAVPAGQAPQTSTAEGVASPAPEVERQQTPPALPPADGGALLPCPFCGSAAEHFEEGWLCCSAEQCGINVCPMRTADWNRRAASPTGAAAAAVQQEAATAGVGDAGALVPAGVAEQAPDVVKDARTRKLEGLLIDARGHLKGYSMSMLARTRSELIDAIDAALQEATAKGSSNGE